MDELGHPPTPPAYLSEPEPESDEPIQTIGGWDTQAGTHLLLLEDKIKTDEPMKKSSSPLPPGLPEAAARSTISEISPPCDHKNNFAIKIWPPMSRCTVCDAPARQVCSDCYRRLCKEHRHLFPEPNPGPFRTKVEPWDPFSRPGRSIETTDLVAPVVAPVEGENLVHVAPVAVPNPGQQQAAVDPIRPQDRSVPTPIQDTIPAPPLVAPHLPGDAETSGTVPQPTLPTPAPPPVAPPFPGDAETAGDVPQPTLPTQARPQIPFPDPRLEGLLRYPGNIIIQNNVPGAVLNVHIHMSDRQ